MLGVNDGYYSHNEGRTHKLGEKQRILPALFPFRIATEHLGDRNGREQSSRQDTTDDEQNDNSYSGCPQIVGREQNLQRRICQFLYFLVEVEDEEEDQQDG